MGALLNNEVDEFKSALYASKAIEIDAVRPGESGDEAAPPPVKNQATKKPRILGLFCCLDSAYLFCGSFSRIRAARPDNSRK